MIRKFSPGQGALAVRRLGSKPGFCSSRCAALALVLLCSIFFSAAAQTNQAGSNAPPLPAARIDLSAIGYQPLSGMARLGGDSNLSLDFLDDAHVLFTFNPRKLFTRHPECPPDHDDRLIEAVIFEVSSGKVVRQVEWYVHDRRRYLWSLGSGRFLLRRLNDLYEVDSSLQERLLLSSRKPLLWVTVTADGGQIVAETEDETTAKSKPKQKSTKAMVKIEFFDARSLAVERVVKSQGIVNLEATSSGFSDVSHNLSGKTWLIQFGPTGKERTSIARVRSRCTPDVFYSSGNTLLVGRCAVNSTDYSVTAFTLTGHNLWRQHWDEHRYRPVIRGSEDGSRFAVSTLRLVPGSAGEETRAVEQNVQVLDTASGDRTLSVNATSALVQQNFSLSPDGSKLALVRDSAIEAYCLPAMSVEERAKYTAVKADVPGLYMASPEEGASEEPTFAAAENESESAEDKPSGAGTGSSATGQSPAVPAQNASAANTPALPITQVPPDIATQMTFKVSTQIVAVDVVVSDSHGHPVKGLKQEEFALTEDGKPQPIRYFKEISESEPAPAPAPPPEKLPPNIFTNNTAAPEAGAVTVILFDLLNTPLSDQRYAQEQLLKFLKNKPKDLQFALCTLSNTLRLIQGFTSDENLLLAAVNGKKGAVRTPPLLHSDAENDSALRFARQMAQGQGSNAGFILSMLEQGQAEARAQDFDIRMYMTVDAFAELARYLSGVPGRKNLIWLSASFPMGILPGGNFPDPFSETRRYADHIRKATNLLADSHVAVYPVDVRGTMTDSIFNAANPTEQAPTAVSGATSPLSSFAGFSGGPNGIPSAAGANSIRPGAIGTTPQQDAMQGFMLDQIAEHGTMDEIAHGTGGKAFYNTNGIDRAIATATEQGSHYYALSYTPASKKYDGRFRKIKVTLAGTKYHLAYRSGYFALDPDNPVKKVDKEMKTDLALAAMQHGSPQSRQVLFAAKVVPTGKPRKVDNEQVAKVISPTKNKKGPAGLVEMQHYAIDYVVVPSQLRFGLAADGTYHGVLGFLVTSFDDDGRLLTRVASEATSNLKADTYKEVMTGGYRLHQELDVPVAAVSLRMGVQDTMSNRIGTLEIPLPVRPPPDAPHGWFRPLPDVEPD